LKVPPGRRPATSTLWRKPKASWQQDAAPNGPDGNRSGGSRPAPRDRTYRSPETTI